MVDEKALTRAVKRAMENAGTLPAKQAVKLVPADWHRICDLVLNPPQALPPGSTGETEGWRDIESAPKEEWLLVWTGTHVEMACCRDGRWLVANSYGVMINPTHWRPLPEPPKSTVGER